MPRWYTVILRVSDHLELSPSIEFIPGIQVDITMPAHMQLQLVGLGSLQQTASNGFKKRKRMRLMVIVRPTNPCRAFRSHFTSFSHHLALTWRRHPAECGDVIWASSPERRWLQLGLRGTGTVRLNITRMLLKVKIRVCRAQRGSNDTDAQLYRKLFS